MDVQKQFLPKGSFHSTVGQLGTYESYKYADPLHKKRESPRFDVYLDDPKYKWVKEAMEVEHEAYDKLMTTFLPDFNMVGTYYSHKATGLTVLSFKTNDSRKEMCFDVCAPTYLSNDRGAAHVLEHAVLVRTKTYNTFNFFYHNVASAYVSFLNALFFRDRTRFYFSSLNEKSYYHTADYMMDAFFRPSFPQDHDVLKQEGWHYKVTKENDKNSNTKELGVNVHGRHVTYSGVVYNEMKKRKFSDPVDFGTSVLYHNLFTNPFKFDSGGNPEDLVELTQKELEDFYKTFYGPKTASVYFYGPNDVYRRLEYVDNYLRKHNVGVSPDPKTGQLSHTASQEVLDKLSLTEEYRDKPKHVKEQFSSKTKDEDMFMMGWVLNPSHKGSKKYDLDSVDKLALEVLSYLLLESSESVLLNKLVSSKFATRRVGPGLDEYFPAYEYLSFMFGVTGVKYTEKTRDSNAKTFEKMVLEALTEVVTKGFNRKAVEAALNKVEFKHTEKKYEMKEHRRGYYPRGLALLRLVKPRYQEGKDPFELLRFEQLFPELKLRVFSDDSCSYLSNLVKKHLLNNNTRVTLHLEAVESSKFEKEFNKKVSDHLRERVSKLTKEQVDEMEKAYNKFKSEREADFDPKVFDSFHQVDLSELKKDKVSNPSKLYKLTSDSLTETTALHSDKSSVTVVVHPVESRSVFYMNLAVSVDSLTVEELKYLKVFTSLLGLSKNDKLSSEEVSYKRDNAMGNLWFSTFFSTQTNNSTYDDPTKSVGFLVVRAKSLKHTVNEMVDVVTEALSKADFSDSKKGVEVVKRTLSFVAQLSLDQAHKFALRRMASKFSVSDYADEVVNGYSQLNFLKETLVPLAEKDWSKVESKLNEMRTKLLSMKNLTVNLGGDSELLDSFLDDSTTFHSKLSSTFKNDSKSSDKVWVKEVLDKKLMETVDKNEVLVMPVRNNYVGVGGKLFDKSDKKSGSHQVVLHFLLWNFLYKQLRASRSAYGVHAYLLKTGHVALVSYADPNFLETLEVYKKVPSALLQAHEVLTDKALKMFVSGTLSTMDREEHPDDLVYSRLTSKLRGETEEWSLKNRKEVLETTKEVFKQVADKFNKSKDWLNVTSVVNKSSADTAPSSYKKLT
ncbi:Peptidase M16C associated family protein [Theileria parva strain Muguga]|uniref:Falcilysin, putative n=1 Tax=Theileria parva TaxID=5875 RepID=Q4N5N3_THEPA|nr:Peptidase M16C associated family protein [Theileria parva strain Muguga]EAN32540.1 Peptidase M16C associated family protein [Theileria parva strain Muguga]|eukprot:XP_764823.1 falcilysin [Theileria parva strain Muguga]